MVINKVPGGAHKFLKNLFLRQYICSAIKIKKVHYYWTCYIIFRLILLHSYQYSTFLVFKFYELVTDNVEIHDKGYIYIVRLC